MSDHVNNPKHYTSHPSGVECIQITEHMNFNLGNCLKYLWRNGLKDGNPSIQDLKKAKWYLEREIFRLDTSAGQDIKDVPEADKDGWIMWSGGECPVTETAMVEVKFKNNVTNARQASDFRWNYNPIKYNRSYDIIAYRVIEQTKPEPSKVCNYFDIIVCPSETRQCEECEYYKR